MASDGESGFWGEYEYGIDDKFRVVMPPDFRDGLGAEFVLTRAPEHAIYVFSMPVWREIEKRLRGPALQREKAYLRQMMGGSRTLIKLDPQGRLSIPKHLRDWAEIKPGDSAVIVGQDSNLEIWSKANWDRHISGFSYDRMYDAVEAAGLAEIISS